MANVPTGTEIIAGFKKASAWATPVVLGAGDGILILNEGMEGSPEILNDESLGNPFLACTDLGNITDEGDIECNLKYEGLLTVIACAMGLAGVPSLLTNGYEHLLECTKNIEGLFGTFAIDKRTKVHEHPSVKVAGFTISGEAGGYLKITFNFISNTLDTGSTTNTSVTMANITIPLLCGNIVFNNGVFLLKDQGGSAPSDPTDRVLPNSFELAFSRNLSGDYTANGNRQIIEPEQDGQPEITCSFGFPRYTDSRFLEDLFSKQEHEAIINWTGEIIGVGPDNYEFEIELPKLVLTDSNIPVSGLGKMPYTANYKVLDIKGDTPTGFQINDGPFLLKFINAQSTDPLA